MSFVTFVKKNKHVRSSLLTMVLALVTVLSVLLAMFQVTAWFKNFQNASTPAVLTNFETHIEYSIGNNSWEKLDASAGIPVIISNNAVKLDITRIDGLGQTPNSLQVRIVYTGKSNAFVRFSLHGSFQNADTGTYLPQSDGLWTVKGTDWSQNMDTGYVYYKNKVGCVHSETASVGSYSETHTLSTLTITLDFAKLASVVSPHQDYQGDLYIHVDAVQPDRFQEFWGISSF